MKINTSTLQADGLLFLVAIIWGTTFIAQSSGMDSLGPFAFNALRFSLGSLAILPFYLWQKRSQTHKPDRPSLSVARTIFVSGGAGLFMFGGISFQQAGLVTTTAGNAGFITTLYVVFVPVISLMLGKSSSFRIWVSVVLALAGLYILSFSSGFKPAPGDILVLIGAVFWALHIVFIGRFGHHLDSMLFSIGQNLTCSLLSFAGAFLFESQPFAGTMAAMVPLLYSAILSTAVAFTLQIHAQKKAHPAHVSIILSMESLIAAISGIIFLGEPLTLRLVIGGALMLAGTLISQLEQTESA